jgi:hypothetical protein
MIDVITLPAREFVFNEDKHIGVFLKSASGASLSAVTAQVVIYDSAGTIVLAATAMNMSGTTRRKATWFLTTGSSQTITAAGTYRALFLVSHVVDSQTEITIYQQQIYVRTYPF